METIPQILEQSVASFADRPAVRRCGEAGVSGCTYRQLGAKALALAGRLVGEGARKGVHVAFLCENCPEWAFGYFAVHLTGAVLVPLDTHLKPAELRAILQRDGAPLLIASRAMMPLASQAAEGLPALRAAVLEDLLEGASAGETDAPPQPVGCQVNGDDIAVISFTSGSTAESKGIVLTHRNIAANAVASGQRIPLGTGDRLVSILPLSHLFEQTAGLLTVVTYGCSVAYPGSLNPRTILDAMVQTRATVVLLVPVVARLFQKRILSSVQSGPAWKRRLFRACRALSRLGWGMGLPTGKVLFAKMHQAFGGSVRFFVSGGAALDSDLARFFMDLGLPVLQGYGLAEAAPVVACNRTDDHVIGSVGRLLPGMEARIDPVESCGDGAGEILLRGPNVMVGYYQNPQATADVLQDGWLRTGDLGRLDRRGYLYVLGRIKDVIIGESGKNIYPTEIEERICDSPFVREACVLGVTMRAREGHPDGARGPEEVAALVVPDLEALGGQYLPPHEEVLRQEVRKACVHLADYKKPRYFAVWPGELPRTTTLKIKKHQVRKDLGGIRLKPL